MDTDTTIPLPPSTPMSTNSTFQQRFPLSPKKFTKKMLGEILGGLIYSFLLAVVPIGIYIAVHGDDIQQFDVKKAIWLFVAFVFFLFLVRIILYAWYWKVYIRKYFYDAKDDFITIRKGVFTQTEIHVQYRKIQDVYVDQDLTDRILGLYDVHIASATVSSGIEAHIDGVEKDAAEKIKDIFLQRITSGGAPGANSGPDIAPQSKNAMAESITFPKAISTSVYPISNKWIGIGIFSFFCVDIFLFFLGLLQVFTPNESESEVHPITNSFMIYAVCVTLVVLLFQIIFLFIWKKNYYFDFLSGYIVMRTGIISRQEMHIPYSSVQDIMVTQNIIERMLGLGTVYIQNAVANGMSVSLVGQKIDSANEIGQMLRASLTQINSNYSRI